MQDKFDKYKTLIKANLLPLALGIIGLIFFGCGLIWLFFGSQSASRDIIFEPATENSKPNSAKIVVDIEGAVLKSGVYTLSSDSRLKDALVAAGGLSAEADREWVAKNLNLAVRLSDGAKIYVPAKGEAQRDTSIKSIKGSTDVAGGQININSASEGELDSLPGVGPVTAQKIIAGRPYASIEDLLNKKIVGSKVFSQIKDRITVY